MQFTFDLDIHGIVAQATSPEKIQPLLDKAITEAIKSAINDATGYNSDFRKSLVEQLQKSLPHGLAIDEVAKFQFVLNNAMNAAVHGANAEAIRVAMSDAVKSIMPDVPVRITLTELMEAAREGFHKEKHESFYALFEPSTYGGGHLYLDSDSSCDRQYSARHRLAFNEKGEVYTLRMDNTDITPKRLPQAVSHFDGLLLSLYVGRSTIEIDMDESDVADAAEAQYD